jgi:hypothetical protein
MESLETKSLRGAQGCCSRKRRSRSAGCLAKPFNLFWAEKFLPVCLNPPLPGSDTIFVKGYSYDK